MTDTDLIAAWLDSQAAKERELLASGRCNNPPLAQERWLVYKACAQSVREGAWREKEPTARAVDVPAPAPRPLVTLTEHVTEHGPGLDLRVEVKLLGYVVEHYTGHPDASRAVAAIKAREVEAVAAELLKDRGWSLTRKDPT